MTPSLGILGGLGPLASAEFLKTFYEENLEDCEQNAPICLLYSDPTFPERVSAIARGEEAPLVQQLERSLETLCDLGVDKIAIACTTMHYFLPQIRQSLREKVISLVELSLKAVLESDRQHLLLCANGARQARVFEQHELWEPASDRLIQLDNDDQQQLSDCIFQLKLNRHLNETLDYFDTLSKKYEVNSLIAGCSELHLVHKHLKSQHNPEKHSQFAIVDPLVILSKIYRSSRS
jgi:aspartate racemase